MLRPWWQRALAGILAVWFALVMVDPGVLHACPVHGGYEAPGAGAGSGGHDHAAHGMAVGEDDGARVTDNAPAPTDDHGSCTCTSHCSAGQNGAGLAPPQPRLTEVPVRDGAIGLPSADTRPVPAPPYFLPFANGPPSVRLA